MYRDFFKMTCALGMLTLGAQMADAETAQNCAPRAVVLERLAERFDETRQAIGLGTQGAVVEVFASDASGSWTITVTFPNGATCLVASGHAYEQIAEALPPKGDGA